MKFSKTILEIISFGTPKAIVFNLTSILLILAAIPTNYLAYSPTKCVFKTFILPILFNGHCPATGIFSGCQCPACGLTRAMSRLLHGDFVGALNYNKIVFLVLSVMIVVIIINVAKIIRENKELN
jgi:hypothetical protein